jgi:hypothetical protein
VWYAGLLGHHVRNPAEVERFASQLIELSTRQTFPFLAPYQVHTPVVGQAAHAEVRKKTSLLFCPHDEIFGLVQPQKLLHCHLREQRVSHSLLNAVS